VVDVTQACRKGTHVADKESLFRQILAVLKSAGLFVIADWIFPHASIDRSAPLVCETKESYELILTNTGFGEITFRDDSNLFLGYAKELLSNLENNRELIDKMYGQELISTIRQQHEELLDKINQHQKFATRIIAKINHIIVANYGK